MHTRARPGACCDQMLRAGLASPMPAGPTASILTLRRAFWLAGCNQRWCMSCMCEQQSVAFICSPEASIAGLDDGVGCWCWPLYMSWCALYQHAPLVVKSSWEALAGGAAEPDQMPVLACSVHGLIVGGIRPCYTGGHDLLVVGAWSISAFLVRHLTRRLH